MKQAVMTVLADRLQRYVDLNSVVYEIKEMLTNSEQIRCFVNLRGGCFHVYRHPRLSLDNLGCRPHTGGKK